MGGTGDWGLGIWDWGGEKLARVDEGGGAFTLAAGIV